MCLFDWRPVYLFFTRLFINDNDLDFKVSLDRYQGRRERFFFLLRLSISTELFTLNFQRRKRWTNKLVWRSYLKKISQPRSKFKRNFKKDTTHFISFSTLASLFSFWSDGFRCSWADSRLATFSSRCSCLGVDESTGDGGFSLLLGDLTTGLNSGSLSECRFTVWGFPLFLGDLTTGLNAVSLSELNGSLSSGIRITR